MKNKKNEAWGHLEPCILNYLDPKATSRLVQQLHCRHRRLQHTLTVELRARLTSFFPLFLKFYFFVVKMCKFLSFFIIIKIEFTEIY